MPDISVRTKFLKSLHLFRGLSDADLTSVASGMDERTFAEPDVVFLENSSADAFYIIFQGRVNISRKVSGKEKPVASLIKGDYFGEQGLLTKRKHNATVRAEKGTVLLVLYFANFKALLNKISDLRPNFLVMMDSRRLARNMDFKWIWPDEVIYFFARKHPLLLYRRLAMPALFLLLPIFLFILAPFLNFGVIVAGLGAFTLVLILAWAVWEHVDWANDYYIVTNQRVIWLEKVVMLYDSRQEAPMTTILSVNTESDYWGRRFDYGTVIVRTFTGQIRMEYLRHPRQAAAMIEEYWERSKQRVREGDESVIKNAIRQKLGYAVPSAPAPPPPPPAPKKREDALTPLRELIKSTFSMRMEEGGTVTYHKHWYVLFRDNWRSIGLFILFLLAPIVYGWMVGVPPPWLILIAVVGMGVALGWWLYGLADWKNDLYQVTPDQIIDVYKEPFGSENRRSAPLDGILSTEYTRAGVIGMLFNFGTVYIAVGGDRFDFADVYDPPTVQQDIVRRAQVKLQKKRESDGAAERDRMANWLAYYHKTMQDIEREKKQSSPGAPQ